MTRNFSEFRVPEYRVVICWTRKFGKPAEKFEAAV